MAVRRLAACSLCCIGMGCWSASPSEAAAPAGGVAASAFGSALAVPGTRSLGEDQQLGGAEEARFSTPVVVAAAREAWRTKFAQGPLLVQGMQWLVGDQQVYDSEQVRLDSPRAFAARRRSQTAFENLGPASAARVALEAFPQAVGQLAAGTPPLSPGDRVARYLSANVAQLALPDRKRAVIQSFGGPMAIETSRRHFAPIDLGLKETSEGFTPAATGEPVHIPKRLARGVAALGSGVSITPVGAEGRPLGGSPGVKDGASVLYANTQTDTDTVAKPTSSGFELAAILRSIASPSELYYDVHAPGGARLTRTTTGGVQVSVDGHAVGVVLAPAAVDAAGSPVPVSMSVAGDLLALHVETGGGEHMWPIDVDPLYVGIDEELEGGCTHGPGWVEEDDGCTEGHTSWQFIPLSGTPFVDESCYCKGEDGHGYIKWHPDAEYKGSEATGINYRTQGESRIYAFRSTSEGTYSDPAWVAMEILTHEGAERTNWTYVNSTETGHYATTATICAHYEGPSTCEPSAGTLGNEARFLTLTTQSGGASAFSQEVSKAWVWISQEKLPELAFNTSSSEIASAADRPNVLYGNGSWIGPYSGALEVEAIDHGVGVSRFEANIDGYWVGGAEPMWEGDCKGVQCNETSKVALTYNQRMPSGEDELEINASDALNQGDGTYGVTHKLKVDATPPYNLAVTGWSSSREISATHHTVTVKATDGKAPVPSSGVKSISVKIDGGPETVLSGSSCAPGECTASGEYTIDAEDLPEGVNTMIVTATDNADNVAASELTFDVRAASPLPVGPGSVDPTTGQLQLNATDVSLGGITGVSRVYRSREVSEGESGPFGPPVDTQPGGQGKPHRAT